MKRSQSLCEIEYVERHIGCIEIDYIKEKFFITRKRKICLSP